MLISLLVFFCTVILISDSCVGFIFTHRWVFAFELAERRCSAQSYNYRSIHELGLADSQCPSIVHHPPLPHLQPPTFRDPCTVSVAAINGADAGEPVSVVEFTAEGCKYSPSSLQQFKSYHFIHSCTQFPYLLLEILVPLN